IDRCLIHGQVRRLDFLATSKFIHRRLGDPQWRGSYLQPLSDPDVEFFGGNLKEVAELLLGPDVLTDALAAFLLCKRQFFTDAQDVMRPDDFAADHRLRIGGNAEHRGQAPSHAGDELPDEREMALVGSVRYLDMGGREW